MKKLEDKIIKRVFVFETKKAFIEIVAKFVLIIALGFFAYIFALVIIDILHEQAAFDLFQIFSEDMEVVRKYIFEAATTFYHELPKLISIFFLAIFIALAALLFFIVKNFSYFKKRIRAIVKFWLKKGKKM